MKKSLIILGFLFFWLTVVSTNAYAWSKQGHLAICDLAYRNLTVESRVALNDLLQVDQGGIQVSGRGKMRDRFYTSFNFGCLEEDAIPRRHPHEHFLNLSRKATMVNSASCVLARNCIFTGIDRDLAILGNSELSNEERVFALMAIGHWIGDLHQPLHVSFKDDTGGNGIVAKLEGKCGTSSYRVKNLHGVWDNCILQAGMFERIRQSDQYDSNWSDHTITYRAVDALQKRTSHAEELSIVLGEPWEWANESFQITIDPKVLYCFKVGEICQYTKTQVKKEFRGDKRMQVIEQNYLREFDMVAENRVRFAGFRLAHLMNLALDSGYSVPIKNSTQTQ